MHSVHTAHASKRLPRFCQIMFILDMISVLRILPWLPGIPWLLLMLGGMEPVGWHVSFVVPAAIVLVIAIPITNGLLLGHQAAGLVSGALAVLVSLSWIIADIVLFANHGARIVGPNLTWRVFWAAWLAIRLAENALYVIALVKFHRWRQRRHIANPRAPNRLPAFCQTMFVVDLSATGLRLAMWTFVAMPVLYLGVVAHAALVGLLICIALIDVFLLEREGAAPVWGALAVVVSAFWTMGEIAFLVFLVSAWMEGPAKNETSYVITGVLAAWSLLWLSEHVLYTQAIIKLHRWRKHRRLLLLLEKQ